jgi:tape measure domain-containing protein
MATEVELERLVTRLVSDIAPYLKGLNVASEETRAKMSRISSDVDRAMDSVSKDMQTASATAREAAKAQADAMAKGAAITKSVETASERYGRELRELENLWSRGAITQSVYMRALEKSKESYNRANEGATQILSNTDLLAQKLMVVSAAAKMAGAALQGALIGPAKSAVMAAGKFEQTTIAFETMLGSAGETKSILNDLVKFAAETPFEMPEIEQAARGLILFGDRGKELMESLEIIGNAAAGTSSQFGELALIFNQVRGNTKLMHGDFHQLSTRGVISLQDLAKHFKKTTDEVDKMMSEGKVSFNDLRAILKTLSSEGGRFNNLMQRQSSSLLGLFSTLSDSIGIMSRKLGDELAPTVKKVTAALIEVANKFDDLPPVVRAVIAGTAGLTVATGALLVAVGSLSLAYKFLLADVLRYIATITLAKIATVAWTGVLYTLYGVLLVAKLALVGFVAYLYFEWTQALSGARRSYEEFSAALKRSNELNEESLNKFKKQTDEVLAKANAMSNLWDRKAFLGDALKVAEKELQGHIAAVKGAEENVRQLDSRWKRWTGNKILEVANKELEGLSNRLAAARGRVQGLQDAMSKVRLPDENPEFAKDIKEMEDRLKETIATMDMAGRQAEIFRLKLKYGVSDAAIKAAMDLAKLSERMEEFRKISGNVKSTFDSIKEEVDFFGIDSESRRIIKLREELAKLREMEIRGPDGPGNVQKIMDRYKPLFDKLKDAEAVIELRGLKEAQKQLHDDATGLMERFKEPIEVYKETVAKLQEMLDKDLIDETVFAKAMDEAKLKLKGVEKAVNEVRQAFERFDAALKNTAESNARIEQWFDFLRSMRLQIKPPELPIAPRPHAPVPVPPHMPAAPVRPFKGFLDLADPRPFPPMPPMPPMPDIAPLPRPKFFPEPPRVGSLPVPPMVPKMVFPEPPRNIRLPKPPLDAVMPAPDFRDLLERMDKAFDPLERQAVREVANPRTGTDDELEVLRRIDVKLGKLLTKPQFTLATTGLS